MPGRSQERFELPAESRLKGVCLRVRDVDAMLGFYRDLLGLPVVDESDDRVVLGHETGILRIGLEVDPGAVLHVEPSVGLYHVALLLPNRRFLAQIVERLTDRGRGLHGASDHGVSEAVYLSDPEGNGLELYRDRDPSEWPRKGDEVAMVTRPLDLGALLEASPEPSGLHPATRLGHVHLHVADLEEAGGFYEQIGLHMTQSTYPGALFMAAGAYHHHVGLNTWAGTHRAPDGATGLVSYTWQVPRAILEDLRGRLDGCRYERGVPCVSAVDPAGVAVRLEGTLDERA